MPEPKYVYEVMQSSNGDHIGIYTTWEKARGAIPEGETGLQINRIPVNVKSYFHKKVDCVWCDEKANETNAGNLLV